MPKRKNRKNKKQQSSSQAQPNQSSSYSFSPVFHEQFKEDLRWWAATNKKVYAKVFDLIEDILDGDPFTGRRHPELLKYINYSGVWSRRIDQEHRIVYRVHNQKIHFLQGRYHY